MKTYQIDLSSTDVNEYKKIADTFSDLDISFLINNAGVAKIQKVGEGDIQNMELTIKTNMGPYVYLTHFLIGKLSKRGNGKRSAIIFVSSSGADLTVPYLSTYVASKLFDDQFA